MRHALGHQDSALSYQFIEDPHKAALNRTLLSAVPVDENHQSQTLTFVYSLAEVSHQQQHC